MKIQSSFIFTINHALELPVYCFYRLKVVQGSDSFNERLFLYKTIGKLLCVQEVPGSNLSPETGYTG
jgi:hypothetical protein